MKAETFKKAQSSIVKALGKYAEPSDEMMVSVIFGFDEDGEEGWLLVQSDYPHFSITNLGLPFEVAMNEAFRLGKEAEDE